MSKAGMALARRCWDNASQENFDFRFVIIVAKQLDDLGKLSEHIVASLEN